MMICFKSMEAMITAICSGGDWTDASVDHVVMLVVTPLERLQKEWRVWYEGTYLPALRQDKKPTFYTFSEWLIEKGYARKVKAVELEVYYE